MGQTTKKESLKPYEAKVEFLSLKEEIEQRRKAGYSIQAIYNQLKGDGHLNMCYGVFCKYVRKSEGRFTPKKGLSDETFH